MIYTLVHWTKYDRDLPDIQTFDCNSLQYAVKVAEEYMQNPFTIAVSENGSSMLKFGNVVVARFINYKFKDYTDEAYRLGLVGNIKHTVDCWCKVTPNLQQKEIEV